MNNEAKLPHRQRNIGTLYAVGHIFRKFYALCALRQEGFQKRRKTHVLYPCHIQNRSIQNHGTNFVERMKYTNIHKNCQNRWEKSTEEAKNH